MLARKFVGDTLIGISNGWSKVRFTRACLLILVFLAAVSSKSVHADPLSVVILIDRSGSMRTNDPNGEVLSASAEIVLSYAEFIDPVVSAAIVEFSDQVHSLTGDGLVDSRLARRAISPHLFRPGEGGTSTGAALATAFDHLSSALGDKRVFLFTDGEPTDTIDVTALTERAANEGISIHVVGFGSNVSVFASPEYQEISGGAVEAGSGELEFLEAVRTSVTKAYRSVGVDAEIVSSEIRQPTEQISFMIQEKAKRLLVTVIAADFRDGTELSVEINNARRISEIDRSSIYARTITAFGLESGTHRVGVNFDPRSIFSRLRGRIYIDALPATDPFRDIAGDKINALRLFEVGRHEDAVQLADQVYFEATALFGESHPFAVSAGSNLASLLSRIGRKNDANVLFSRVFDVSRQALGDQHPMTVAMSNNFAHSLFSVGEPEAAIQMISLSLAQAEAQYGSPHPESFVRLSSLGAFLASEGRLRDAEAAFQEVLNKTSEYFGDNHAQTLAARTNLAAVQAASGQLSSAETSLRASVDTSSELFRRESASFASVAQNLAVILAAQGRFTEARALLKEALKSSEASLTHQHPLLPVLEDTLIEIERVSEGVKPDRLDGP
ncbi:MAG: tetratricopeptide repeat protein [Rhodobacter sp.]|nr:tetratricopeptide repeat protein [Rhodobacter sp.]